MAYSAQQQKSRDAQSSLAAAAAATR